MNGKDAIMNTSSTSQTKAIWWLNGQPTGWIGGTTCVSQTTMVNHMADGLMRCRLTPEQISWAENQPLVGNPSLTRLRSSLTEAGFAPISLELTEDREDVCFRLKRHKSVRNLNVDQTELLLIVAFRKSGFDVSFTEVRVDELNAETVIGESMVTRLEQLNLLGPPEIEP
jgi:hypothetical protein